MYIILSIIVFIAIIAGLVVLKKRGRMKKLSRLTTIAMVFVVAGITMDKREIAYPLIGIGIVLAIIDMVQKSRARNG